MSSMIFFLCPTENAGQLENSVTVFLLFGAWFLAGGMGALGGPPCFGAVARLPKEPKGATSGIAKVLSSGLWRVDPGKNSICGVESSGISKGLLEFLKGDPKTYLSSLNCWSSFKENI